MDETWEAPAKVNLSLLVGAVDFRGYHPIRSLVQTMDWVDVIRFTEDDEDHLEVRGADLSSGGENLVWKGIEALEADGRPQLRIQLEKSVAVAAGLGGGSADAAAAICAIGGALRLPEERLRAAAEATGADVPYFLTGGTAWIEGYGEKVTPVRALDGFAIAVVVPPFELKTPEVYRRWDELDRPSGPELPARSLPPALREFDDLRNDLTPAAASLRPELADWLSELAGLWDRPVAMSGSGPAVFGLFADEEEAREAAAAAPARAARGAGLRRKGVAHADR